ncbi:MAG: 39S ribosomal protein L45 [Gammaproteobacteria bacterium]|nr:39S ribosomal protein L45 [Gammaproteobacteria bacterium]
MKSFWAIFAMIFVFAVSSGDAHAKKFGGGKSFGKTHQTAPAQQRQQPAADNPSGSAAQAGGAASGAAAGAAKKGLLGGLMGGLLAGGLIAALFGGAFEGLQIMDILIMALIGFVIFKLLRSRRGALAASAPQAAVAGAAPAPQRPSFDFGQPASAPAATPVERTATGAGFAAAQVPFNLPAGFDMTAFLQGAREHYRTLQEAWNRNDLSLIQEYASPALYNELRAERATLSGEQHTEVLFVDAELVRADQMFGKAELSIRFSGRYRDSVEGVEEPINDIWHLERDLGQDNSPWYIVGIES